MSVTVTAVLADGMTFTAVMDGVIPPHTPAAAAELVSPAWSGRATTAGAASTLVVDGDVFDGSVPAIMESWTRLSLQRQQGWTSGAVLGVVAVSRAQEVMADVVTRLGPLVALTSATSATIRGAFLPPTALPPPSDRTAWIADYVPFGGDTNQTVVRGAVVLQTSVACGASFPSADHALAECPDTITDSLARHVLAKADEAGTACPSPTPLPHLTSSYLSLDVAASQYTLIPRGMRASTTAIFQCGGGATTTASFVSVSLTVTQDSQGVKHVNGTYRTATAVRWPSPPFFRGGNGALKSAVHMVKSIPLAATGVLTATSHANTGNDNTGDILVMLPFDMFGTGRGGVFLTDSTLNVTSRMAAMLTAGAKALATGFAPMDAAIASALMVSRVSDIMDRCSALYTTPSLLRCLHVMQTMSPSQVQCNVAPDASAVTFSVGVNPLTSSASWPSDDSSALAGIVTTKLTQLVDGMKDAVGQRDKLSLAAADSTSFSTTAQFAGSATVPVPATSAAAAALTGAPVGHPQMGALVTVSATYRNRQPQWDWDPQWDPIVTSFTMVVDVANAAASITAASMYVERGGWWWIFDRIHLVSVGMGCWRHTQGHSTACCRHNHQRDSAWRGSAPVPTVEVLAGSVYNLDIPHGTVMMPTNDIKLLGSTQQVLTVGTRNTPHFCLHGALCTPAQWQQTQILQGDMCGVGPSQDDCRRTAVVALGVDEGMPLQSHCAAASSRGDDGELVTTGVVLQSDVAVPYTIAVKAWPVALGYAVALAVAVASLLTMAVTVHADPPSGEQRADGDRDGAGVAAVWQWLCRLAESVGVLDMYLPILCMSVLHNAFAYHGTDELLWHAAMARHIVVNLGSQRDCASTHALWNVTIIAWGALCLCLKVFEWLAHYRLNRGNTLLGRCGGCCAPPDFATASRAGKLSYAARRFLVVAGVLVFGPFVAAHVHVAVKLSLLSAAAVALCAMVTVLDEPCSGVAISVLAIGAGVLSRTDVAWPADNHVQLIAVAAFAGLHLIFTFCRLFVKRVGRVSSAGSAGGRNDSDRSCWSRWCCSCCRCTRTNVTRHVSIAMLLVQALALAYALLDLWNVQSPWYMAAEAHFPLWAATLLWAAAAPFALTCLWLPANVALLLQPRDRAAGHKHTYGRLTTHDPDLL